MRLRYVFHRMIERDRPFLQYWRSDDCWKASLHFNWTWRGKHYWLCFFLPDWMP
jgi:hypothetical protein